MKPSSAAGCFYKRVMSTGIPHLSLTRFSTHELNSKSICQAAGKNLMTHLDSDHEGVVHAPASDGIRQLSQPHAMSGAKPRPLWLEEDIALQRHGVDSMARQSQTSRRLFAEHIITLFSKQHTIWLALGTPLSEACLQGRWGTCSGGAVRTASQSTLSSAPVTRAAGERTT